MYILIINSIAVVFDPSLIILKQTILLSTAVSECRQELLAAGFKELNESDHWDLKPCDKVSVVVSSYWLPGLRSLTNQITGISNHVTRYGPMDIWEKVFNIKTKFKLSRPFCKCIFL